jgi:hypothetical protein
MVRDLILWMDDIIRQMKTQEKPRHEFLNYILYIHILNYLFGSYF